MKINQEGKLEKVTNLDVQLGIIILPSNVISIGKEAFKEADTATKIVWNSNIQKIDAYAFSQSAFTELIIPQSVTEIEDMAFAITEYLQKIYIKNSQCKLSRDAFAYCSFLKLLEIGDKQYIVRAFNDGNVWEIISKVGYDIVNSYYGRPLFSQDNFRYVSKRINTIGYGKTLKDAINDTAAKYYAQPELIRKWKDITLDTYITLDDFQELMGIPIEVINKWLSQDNAINIINGITIRTILNYFKSQTKIFEIVIKPFIQFIMDAYKRRDENLP